MFLSDSCNVYHAVEVSYYKYLLYKPQLKLFQRSVSFPTQRTYLQDKQRKSRRLWAQACCYNKILWDTLCMLAVELDPGTILTDKWWHC